MVTHFGDYSTSETVVIPFNTFTSDDPSASSTITNLAAGDIEIHKDGGTTQRTSDNGVTVSINFDSVTGNHLVSIDLSDDTDSGFYSAGSRYQVRMEGTTVDGATINAWIGTFSIGCTLRPTVAGRTLDVSAGGEAGIDWANVGSPTTTVGLSGTTVGTVTTTATATNLTNAPTNGDLTATMKTSVQTAAAAALTAYDPPTRTEATSDKEEILADIATAQADLDILTGADGAVIASGTQTFNMTGNITGNLSGSVGSVTGAVGSVTGNVGGNVTGSVGSLATQAKADVNAEVDAAIETYHLDHLLAVTYDPASKPGAADALLNELVESDGGVARFTANALEEAPTGGSAPTAEEIRQEIDANSTQLAAIVADTNELQTDWTDGGRLDLLIDAVKAKTDQITFTVSNQIDANVLSISGDGAAADNAESYFDGTGYGHLLQRTTIATLASQTSFTLTAGSGDNDAYNGCVIVIQDASSAAQKAVGVIGDYTGSTRTVTLLNDPGVFTMAVSDIVTIAADRALKATVDNRTLDVSTGGEAGVDWSNVGSPSSTVGLSGTTVATVTNGVTVSTNNDKTGYGLASDAVNSTSLATSAVSEIQSGLATSSALATAQSDLDILTGSDGVIIASGTQIFNITGNLSGSVGSVTGNVTGSIGSLATQAKADVNAEVDGALADINLDHLVKSAVDTDFATTVHTNSVVGQIADNGGGFDRTTDSLEALRDRGDAAWTTATGFSTLDDAGVRSAVGLASANLDTQFDAIPTANENADALLDRTAGVETNRTLRQALRLMLAALAGKLSGAATSTIAIRDTNDGKDRLVAEVDSDGNRTAVTYDAT